jgi:hypothetical protein
LAATASAAAPLLFATDLMRLRLGGAGGLLLGSAARLGRLQARLRTATALAAAADAAAGEADDDGSGAATA